MARVTVVNPQPKFRSRTARRRWKNTHRHIKGYYPNPKKKHRKLSVKARAAAIRNLRKARKAKFARKIDRHEMQYNPKRRHHRRKKHAHRKAHKKFVNPFAGTLMTMGNPPRKRRHHMARRKHRRHHRRALSNPFSANALLAAPKEMISPQFIMEAAGVAAGFVLPNMAMNYLPVGWRSTTLTYYASKVGTIAVLSAAGGMVSKRVAKFVLVGGAVSLLLDLYTEFMKGTSPAAVAPAATTAPSTQTFYGNLSAYYGGMMNEDFSI